MKRFFYAVLLLVCFFACKSRNDSGELRLEELQEMSYDTLTSIRDTLNVTLSEKRPGRIDSIKAVGVLRDSLIYLKGKLSAGKLTVPLRSVQYKQLDSTYFAVDEMVIALDDVIMKDIIEIIQPTNAAFRALVKDINDQTEKLEKIAGRFLILADVAKTITHILSSPILKGFFPEPGSAKGT